MLETEISRTVHNEATVVSQNPNIGKGIKLLVRIIRYVSEIYYCKRNTNLYYIPSLASALNRSNVGKTPAVGKLGKARMVPGLLPPE